MSVIFQKTIPVLRIFDVEKAREFYVGFLGFTVDWEHHFEDNSPAYLQVSRAGLTLHLSEHHGDTCPGSTVFVWMTCKPAVRRDRMPRRPSPGRRACPRGDACIDARRTRVALTDSVAP